MSNLITPKIHLNGTAHRNRTRAKLPMEHTTTRGHEIIIMGISPFSQDLAVKSYELQHPKPQKPTYTINLITGDVETHPHSERTLDVPDNPVETAHNYAAWDKYKEEQRLWDGQVSGYVIIVTIEESVQVVNAPAIETIKAWLEEKLTSRRPLVIPDYINVKEDNDLRLLYTQIEIMGIQDINYMMELVTEQNTEGVIIKEISDAAQEAFKS